MREFETIFREGLKQGLRKHHDNPRNAEALVECHNTKPSPGGLIPITLITNPIDVTMSWPYPQLFLTRDYVLAGAGACPNSVIDTLEFDTTLGYDIWAVHLGGGYYAITFRGADSDGWLKTIRVTDAGSVNEVDSYEFTDDSMQYTYIRHVTGSVYAIGYRLAAAAGAFFTISISPTGAIGGSVIDTWSKSPGASASSQIRLIPISGEVYAIVWESGKTVIDTVNIDEGGDFTNIATHDWDTVGFRMYDALLAADNVVLSLISMDNEYRLTTISVSDAGVIGGSNLDTVDYASTGNGHVAMQLLEVASGVFVTSYWNFNDDTCHIETFGVDSAGDIDASQIDTHSFAGCTGSRPWLMKTGVGNAYLVAYTGTAGDGYVRTIDITAAGVITAHATCTTPLEFDAADCLLPVLMPIRGISCPVFYSGVGGDGFVKTIKMTTT